MEAFRGPWAVVLAAGEGSRLRALTTDRQGNSIPKQYCSLSGGTSLLQLALHRAAQVCPWEQITTIVAAQHERWWRGELAFMAARNACVQPNNRGTAVGVLLPLLRVVARDPEARILLLPSDHFVSQEAILARAMGDALVEVDRRPDRVVLLGIVPDEPDTGFGWIVPAVHGGPGAQRVLQFVEKPPERVATELMDRGGVWNSFIVAATAETLLQLFEERMPETVTALSAALARRSGAARRETLAAVYETLGAADFSRDILEGFESRLSVLPVPHCGWSDLGTPARVVRCVESAPRAAPAASPMASRPTGFLDLALAVR